MSGDGSSGEHEAGAGPGSSIDPKTLDLKFTTSDIDLIPMNKTQLTAIPGNTTGKTSFRENFVNVLLNLDIDNNVQMLKKKYYIASSNLQTVYKIIKILAFETLLLDEIGAISYRNLRSTNEFISVLPDWPTNQKPSRTKFAECLSKMTPDIRSSVFSHVTDLTILKYGGETDFPSAFALFSEEAAQYDINFPKDKIEELDDFDDFFSDYLDEEYDDKLLFT